MRLIRGIIIFFVWNAHFIQCASISRSNRCAFLIQNSYFVYTFTDKSINSERRALSHLLELYSKRFALQAVKDYVLNPLHTQWQALQWSSLIPNVEDLSRFVTILDTFNPICHEFVGKIFVKFSWKEIFSSEETITKISPYFLNCIVKLSAEPEVRKVNNGIMIWIQGAELELSRPHSFTGYPDSDCKK